MDSSSSSPPSTHMAPPPPPSAVAVSDDVWRSPPREHTLTLDAILDKKCPGAPKKGKRPPSKYRDAFDMSIVSESLPRQEEKKEDCIQKNNDVIVRPMRLFDDDYSTSSQQEEQERDDTQQSLSYCSRSSITTPRKDSKRTSTPCTP
eukprot:CAMPEP_0118677262 /NCGR_PEP_ID=MMETSP0800-20121206/2527_1 /TAXON_ID=210618 ORGANISM="Striatella unipunctata, Strain CCMP2910" /NCGR_SAMPLE_ID=MMETSP0800 /ASSEMBLY_ACC=CAM_ASM_000638 /LENGTH=146 /DNA_ID=CAMNT_0006572911 /DNA_START=122 /DNA_END=562 /DNA_ORIENTATION=+